MLSTGLGDLTSLGNFHVSIILGLSHSHLVSFEGVSTMITLSLPPLISIQKDSFHVTRICTIIISWLLIEIFMNLGNIILRNNKYSCISPCILIWWYAFECKSFRLIVVR